MAFRFQGSPGSSPRAAVDKGRGPFLIFRILVFGDFLERSTLNPKP